MKQLVWQVYELCRGHDGVQMAVKISRRFVENGVMVLHLVLDVLQDNGINGVDNLIAARTPKIADDGDLDAYVR